MSTRDGFSRRDVLGTAIAATGAAMIGAVSPALAETLRRTPSQVLGPFYPVVKPLDQDADLTVIAGRSGRAAGQVLHVMGRVINSKGEPVPHARMEIWQANSHGRYTHPSDVNPAPLDPNFEGYAVIATDAEGRYRFKTVKPGSYPEDNNRIRAPHIHVDVTGKVNRVVAQIFFAGEPLNETDRFLATALANKESLIASLKPPTGDMEPESLLAMWDLVVGNG